MQNREKIVKIVVLLNILMCSITAENKQKVPLEEIRYFEKLRWVQIRKDEPWTKFPIMRLKINFTVPDADVYYKTQDSWTTSLSMSSSIVGKKGKYFYIDDMRYMYREFLVSVVNIVEFWMDNRYSY